MIRIGTLIRNNDLEGIKKLLKTSWLVLKETQGTIALSQAVAEQSIFPPRGQNRASRHD